MLNWLLLFTVHSTTLAVNICHLYYILIIHHRISFALPPSISSPNLISTSLLPLVVFDMLALPFGIPSLIISDLPNLTLSSNQLQKQSRNSSFLWCKHLWPLAIYIHVLLIRHNHVDFCVLILCYVMLCLGAMWVRWLHGYLWHPVFLAQCFIIISYMRSLLCWKQINVNEKKVLAIKVQGCRFTAALYGI